MKTEYHVFPDLLICAEKEQIRGKGEDAYAYSFAKQDCGYTAVFDGCGGMGSKTYPKLSDKTGARIAARLAGYVVNRLYESGGLSAASTIVESLHCELTSSFEKVKSVLSAGRTGVKIGGDMFKELPCTMSLITVTLNEKRDLLADYLWAGDSRGYFLDKMGLCQVTVDDLETDEDAFSNLRSDAKLSNVINADTAFELHENLLTFREPVLLITTTDGSFGYFKTPMEFEYAILHSMQQAMNTQQWEEKLTEAVSAVAGDDFSIIISAYGFTDFMSCQQYYAQRVRLLRQRFISDAANVDDAQLAALWKEYQKNYYRW